MPYRHNFQSVSMSNSSVSGSKTFDVHDEQGNVTGQATYNGSASGSISSWNASSITMSVSGSTNGSSIGVVGRGTLPTSVSFSPPANSNSDLTGTSRTYSASVQVTAYQDVWIGSRSFSLGNLSCTAVLTSTYYEPPPTYYYAYLYYDANGGSGAPSTDTYQTTSSSGSHEFTISSVAPTNGDLIFAGWATSSSATEAEYQPGDTISVSIGSSVRLYAVWVEGPQFRVYVRTTSWQEAENVYVNVGGTWQRATAIHVMTGSWHQSERRTSHPQTLSHFSKRIKRVQSYSGPWHRV